MGLGFVLSNMRNLLGRVRVMVMAAAAGLGLLSPPEGVYSEEVYTSGIVIVMQGPTPALVPVSVAVGWIKSRVPVVEYGSVLERSVGMGDEDAVCRVCLDVIEGQHGIRELSNCSHVFHQECLDAWMDEGQVTCPLCRSMLLPPRT